MFVECISTVHTFVFLVSTVCGRCFSFEYSIKEYSRSSTRESKHFGLPGRLRLKHLKLQSSLSLARFLRVFSVDRMLPDKYNALHHVPHAINAINATEEVIWDLRSSINAQRSRPNILT